MTPAGQARAAAAGLGVRASKRHGRRRRPGPFPVTIVRAATVAVEPFTPAQRARQRAANQRAHEITEASRHGTRPCLVAPISLSLDRPWLDIRDRVAAIVEDAPALAANPPAGSTRVGRNLRGQVVVAVLHAAEWSLLLRPARPHPQVWVLLGEAEFGISGGGDLLSVEWDEMADAVFTTLAMTPRSAR